MTAIFCWYFIDTVMVQQTRSGRRLLLLILQSSIAKWKSVHLSLLVVTVFALKADAVSESQHTWRVVSHVVGNSSTLHLS